LGCGRPNIVKGGGGEKSSKKFRVERQEGGRNRFPKKEKKRRTS